ncbi:WW domain-containing adapter protein with coiled-coil [Eurytemora carolleeae]|uniref:WW domain-containing adapter protein with coiled-coil n=1 Tax=Eurytemora carolleeae TaxID=1294199 RepID=UPI000C7736B8|nr:WW domain-containing adapter protein with coiled-coil [Eurytemora carolleeae]XP_023345680.1 WW domain-containing adapter protein with coiled-coil [Eurytemora carolleeae]XP_023345681.1 WW domain-containing adapter protein with coiled-coil [Eurytemora carolleeae]XP_023345682.1 WW domain-containing adapter protein with coiled-coil [Eurytemora carolleeae]XP_023345683.1 WW domain-containing adapter protein with coiled-coil [Eurytemora carolleeae]XP_023345684.1 WW domain-containing adapter protei|eukprot:XP_023345679.1 WW domain-containing adapter protein with coiled-coil-like [Eurytemora affinis]
MSQFSGNSMSQYPSTSMSQYPPVSQYPGGAVSLYPGGAVSLSAAIPRISTQHSSGLSKERWESPRSTISQSPTSSSEQTLQQAVLSPLQHLHTTAVTLTPSLARLHREDLISHVQGWPAEQVERGCHRLTEEAHQISSHGITRVSAELKMARSLVRLAEIQATLQEQRILFLKQQMLDMEKYSCISEPEPNSHTIPDSTEHR